MIGALPESASRRPAALLLDFDGTLLDSERAYEEALSAVGLSARDAGYLAARRRVKRRLGDGHVAARNRLLYFKDWLEHRGDFSPAALVSMMTTYEGALARAMRRQWRALGRSRLFARPAIARVPRILVTNENTRTQVLKLRAIDPRGRVFPRMLTSEELGVEKPAPRLFEEARRRLGVPARRCLYVGDSVANDMEPAARLGFAVLLSREFQRPGARTDGRYPSIDSLDELARVFEGAR